MSFRWFECELDLQPEGSCRVWTRTGAEDGAPSRSQASRQPLPRS